MPSGDQRCDVSSCCGRTLDLLRAIGISDELPWRWLHLGPITAATVRVVEHTDSRRSRPRVLPSDGGLGRFGGYSLDLLGMTSPPPCVAANYHHLLGVWYVYAVAWRDAEGPRVEWRADRDGPGELTIRQRGHPALGDAEAIAGRCRDLLLGRLVQRGRPRKSEDEVLAGAALGVQAEAMKAQFPRKTWRVIARHFGADERTLRRVRADARRLGLIDTASVDVVESRRLA